MNSNPILTKGKLLISAPFLNDIFKRSVILLTEHNNEGSVGFIINKPTEHKINELIEDFPEFNAQVYTGGPVQQNSLNFIHKSSDILEGGFEIGEGIYWGGNFEMLKILAANGNLNPDDIKFFIGYSGWGANQLNEELKINSWYLNTPTSGNIFNDESSTLWSRVLKSMGKEYSIISTFPEDPSVN